MSRALITLAALLATTLVGAQGVTDSQIVLGQSVALTGPAAELGKDMQTGAMLYFNHVNKAGGVNGRKIVLKTLDDGYEPPRAVENTKKLINDEKVFALFGYVGTPTSAASMPVFTDAKVPFVGAFTGAESLRAPFNRQIFNVRASYFDETEDGAAEGGPACVRPYRRAARRGIVRRLRKAGGGARGHWPSQCRSPEKR